MKSLHKLAFAIVPFVSAAASASEGAESAAHEGGHGGGAHHLPKISELNWFGTTGKDTAGLFGHGEDPALGWLFITFFVFAFIVLKFARPALRTYLQERAHTVEKAISEAKLAKEAAERRAAEAEAKLAALSDDLVRMKAEFTTQGKAESERIEQAAKAAAVRIQKDAEDTIAAETERARQALRAEASRLALDVAEERIKGALTASDDSRLLKSLVDDLAA